VTTPADELRTAARKIRATAAVTMSGPWNIDGPWWHNDTEGEATHATGTVSAGSDRRTVAVAVPGKPRSESSLAHIALWDPIVAAAVADWLTDWAELDPSERETRCGMCGVDHALQVATAINAKTCEPVRPAPPASDSDRQASALLRPEPTDMTRIEFECGTDVYAAWRNDAEGARAGYQTGDGAPNWVVYGGSVPQTWSELAKEFGADCLNLAVRLLVHPDDAHLIAQWPTQRCRCPEVNHGHPAGPCPIHDDAAGA
jgi:hypothetical protein